MATNNPNPWAMPSTATNGFGAGSDQDASFDPTNPGRRKRRLGVVGDDGGIGGAWNAAAKAAGTAATANAAPAAKGLPGWVAPSETGLAGLHTLSSWLQSDPASRARDAAARAASQPAAATTDANAGRIPAAPPVNTPPSAGVPATPPAFGNVVSRSASTAAPSLVDQGVTLPDGRKLSYGANINGVPTFSDGSGGMPGRPGTIPRTMTQDDIKALGSRLQTVPAGSAPVGFAAPVAFNSDDSEANIANILRSRQGGKFGITPEMNAAADLAAVTNQDPRSTLGMAAMNAGRRAAAAPTVLQRKAALDDLAGLQAAVRANTLATTQGQNALATTNAEGQNALQRTNLGGLYDIAGQRLRNEGDLARADLTGQYGIAAALAKPNAATSLDPDKVNSDAVKLLPQVMGLDPTGQVTDPTTGKTRPPTQAEIAQGLQTARAMLTGQAAPAAASGAQPPVSLDQFMAAAKQAGSKMSDADLRAAYQQRVAALQRSGA